MNVTHTTVADLGEGWTPQGWTIALACGHVTEGVAHMQFSIGDSMLCTEEHPSEAVDAPQDHGPLAAPLSDRTLAKVLSRPAHVPLSEMKSTRVFGFNVVTISPQGIPGGPRLDGVVSRQRAQDELDELEPFMVDGWKTVMVELREVTS